MSDLTTVRAEAQAAATQIASRLDAARSVVAVKTGELADATKAVADLVAEHGTVLAMSAAATVITDVEAIVPKVEQGVQAAETKVAAEVKAHPWLAIAAGALVLAVIVGAVVFLALH